MDGLTPSLLVVLAAATSFVLCGAVYYWLSRWKVLDLPNPRSSHQTPTVRGGGMGVVITIMVGATWLWWERPNKLLGALLCGCFLLSLVSAIDDWRPVPRFGRFAFHCLTAGMVLWGMGEAAIDVLDARLTLGAVLLVQLGFFLWMTGYTNAFNFMDGINGIAAGQAFITSIGAALVGWLAGATGSEAPLRLMLLTAGAAAGFLPYNFPNARMFLGDVGSAPLGFLLASLAIWLASEQGWWLLIPLGLLHANFILDTAFTLCRRVWRGERWYEAHREHFYQRLVRAGRSHTEVTGWEMGLQVVTGILVVAYLEVGTSGRLVLVMGILMIWLVFFSYCEMIFRQSGSITGFPRGNV